MVDTKSPWSGLETITITKGTRNADYRATVGAARLGQPDRTPTSACPRDASDMHGCTTGGAPHSGGCLNGLQPHKDW